MHYNNFQIRLLNNLMAEKIYFKMILTNYQLFLNLNKTVFMA